ncbi:MAG: sigma-54-dependent Fis family transcriptional regulator [Candidatus Cloacimonetes bacterium]|nr:sigma-54-dependent Fis family transcriptional regulator [Candidatus Cloacimonadota bacterium]
MSSRVGKVLAVDDNEDILIALQIMLKQHGMVVQTEKNPNRIPELLQEDIYDVILLDMNFSKDVISGQEGYDWLNRILEIDPEAVVIFITAYGDVEKAVKAVKAGAVDFVLKPWQNEKLLATLSSAIKLRKTRLEASNLRLKQQELSASLDQPFHDFVGNSPAMNELFETINKVAKTDASVLILGENGTGKELVARALHRNSRRNNDVFISVDMGAISETLFESELFGHVRGAFTDAKKDRPGRFEIANGGTLFLDEIGNLSLPMQAKILTVIEKQQVIRVGSNKQHPVDVRLICATNMPIHKMVTEQRFRQDLLYRINTVEISIPPLRERIEDIKPLAEFFLEKFQKKYKKEIIAISPLALKKLECYTWPGNIRELQHALERAVIMSESKQLQPNDFILTSKECEEEEIGFESLNLEDVEIKIIRKVLKKHHGNITQAAKELGLTRTSLYRRLEKYGL